MPTNYVDTGTASRVRLVYSLSSNAAGNYTDIACEIYFDEIVAAGAWNGDGVPWDITFGPGSEGSGTFTFDWRPGGLQSVLIWSGTLRRYHNADGTPPATQILVTTGATGSSSGGPGASFYTPISLPTLKVVPGVPSGLTATRISDTQVNLAWSKNSPASNGQPTQNKIQVRINDGAATDLATISAAEATSVSAAANQKLEYRILNHNAAGDSAYSAWSSAIYTTPGAPTNVVAVKNGSDIDITFDENVAYSSYNHEVWHGTITGGVTTWDGSALTTLAAGVLTYKHVAPGNSAVHVYQVRAKQGTLFSSYAVSNSVQLLVAPAKPTVPALAAFANRSATFRLPWVHNPVDSSPQTKYQWRWSSNGGSSWTTGSKTSSVNQYHDFASGTWSANQTIRFQVRTKGQYDSGSDGDASYSPWSDPVDVTFKSLPVATIVSPADASVYAEAVFRATLGFSQAEAATFVKAELELIQSAVVLEALESTNLIGITFATPVANGGSYSVRARVQDSNGLWSAWVTNAFTVTYTLPVPAVVTTSYLPDSGWGQLDLTIAAPGGGQAAASTVTITRTIDGVEELVVKDYPVASAMTFLDTVPTIHGTNVYKVTTKSAIGAQVSVTANLVTAELRRAFLSRGPGYSTSVCFGGNLAVSESLSVASDAFQAAGRTKPIGLHGVETSVQLKVTSTLINGFGSTKEQVRDALLMSGKACYRGPDGRRVFGTVKGGVSYKAGSPIKSAVLSFTMTETS